MFSFAILKPLAGLSCHLQGTYADLPLAAAKLKVFQFCLARLKTDDPAVPTELSQFIASVNGDDHTATFQGIQLHNSSPEALIRLAVLNMWIWWLHVFKGVLRISNKRMYLSEFN